MKGLATVLVLASLAGAGHHSGNSSTCDSAKARDSATFIAAVWDKNRWRRKEPKATTIAAWRKTVKCAKRPGRLRKIWREAQRDFYTHRRAELWRVRVTPFYGGGNWWAIPYTMVVCESGANYHYNSAGYLPYGAYSILDPAWQEWGGQTAHAGEASEREQDLVAHRGWVLYGEGAWECKSDGSVHWP